MSSRTQDTVPGRARLPHECHPAKIPRVAHRNHRGTPRPHQRASDGTLQCVLRKSLLQLLLTLRQKDLRRVQGCPHGNP